MPRSESAYWQKVTLFNEVAKNLRCLNISTLLLRLFFLKTQTAKFQVYKNITVHV